MAKYGMSILVKGSMDEVMEEVVGALKAQGFGILTSIDIQKVLKEKIGADYEPYLILGACNPQLSNRALMADRSIGLLLPCNVTLRQVGPQVQVSILDPEIMFSVVESDTQQALATLPQEAKTRLQNALAVLEKQFNPS